MSLEKQITAEKSPILSLPESIMLEILRYLPIKDRCRSRRVCKKWKRIVHDKSLWRHVDLLEYRLGLKTLGKIVRTYFSSSLLTLKIKGFVKSDDQSKRRANTLSNPLLKGLTTRCPNLQVLHLNHCKVSQISFDSLPPSLIRLEIDCCIWWSEWMKDKQKRLPNLQYLTLRMCKRMTFVDMADITSWKYLTYLSFSGSTYIGTPSIAIIAEHLSRLEFLNLNETFIDDLAIQYIVKHMKTLKTLYLSKCTVTDEALVLIASELRVLQKLDISYCELVTMTGLTSLFVSSITVLIVNRNASLSEEEKQTLKQGFSENFVLIA